MNLYNGVSIPDVQAPAYSYQSVVLHRGVAYVSGSVPKTGEVILHPGIVGADVTLEQAQDAAEICLLNALASLRHEIGDLDQVEKVLKITVFVASATDFVLQPKVADAASLLLKRIFNERAGHARSAVGVAVLPRNSPVEIEMIVAVKAA